MREDVYGSITLPDKIDITDPSYDEDVWCRMNNVPIQPGEYECYVVMADNEETHGWGNRVAKIGIRSDEATDYQAIGIIGVDAGLAGFFNCDNRIIFDDLISNCCDNVFLYDNAFVSSTGYGDGGYKVYRGTKNGKMVELYIEFISEDDVY